MTDISDVPPEVLRLFFDLTFQLIAKGWKQYSADAILHRIRWHYHVEMGRHSFKCNNNWTAYLSREFLRQHPHHDGFFVLRQIRSH